jgi:hypothetical protein
MSHPTKQVRILHESFKTSEEVRKHLTQKPINTVKCLGFGLDWLHAEKDVNFCSYVALDNELATYNISSIDELCDDREGGGSSDEQGKEEEECQPEPVPSFMKEHDAHETVKVFL